MKGENKLDQSKDINTDFMSPPYEIMAKNFIDYRLPEHKKDLLETYRDMARQANMTTYRLMRGVLRDYARRMIAQHHRQSSI